MFVSDPHVEFTNSDGRTMHLITNYMYEDGFINAKNSDYVFYLIGYTNAELGVGLDMDNARKCRDYLTNMIEIYDKGNLVKEMTVADIEKELGHKVKVVK